MRFGVDANKYGERMRSSVDERSSADFTSSGVARGCCSRYRAAAPATRGTAMLVPDAHVYESGATRLQRPAPAHAE